MRHTSPFGFRKLSGVHKAGGPPTLADAATFPENFTARWIVILALRRIHGLQIRQNLVFSSTNARNGIQVRGVLECLPPPCKRLCSTA